MCCSIRRIAQTAWCDLPIVWPNAYPRIVPDPSRSNDEPTVAGATSIRTDSTWLGLDVRLWVSMCHRNPERGSGVHQDRLKFDSKRSHRLSRHTLQLTEFYINVAQTILGPMINIMGAEVKTH